MAADVDRCTCDELSLKDSDLLDGQRIVGRAFDSLIEYAQSVRGPHLT